MLIGKEIGTGYLPQKRVDVSKILLGTFFSRFHVNLLIFPIGLVAVANVMNESLLETATK